MGKEEAERLYRIRCTVMEMLRDRGYAVSDSDINMTKAEFRNRFGDEPRRDDLGLTRSKSGVEVHVHFASELSKPATEELCERMRNRNINHVIVVTKKSIAKLSMDVLRNIRAETFLDNELIVNVTKHELVPEHKVLTPNEKKEVLEQFCTTESKFPRMLETDAVARYYGLTQGQFVKITRRSGDVAYRCVS